MILGIEIALTVVGLYMLFTGKAMQKGEDIRSWKFRLLGGFCILFWPVVLVLAVGLGVYWAIAHPDATPEQIQTDLRWPGIALEAGVVILWAIIGHFWHKSIVNKVKAEQEAAA